MTKSSPLAPSTRKLRTIAATATVAIALACLTAGEAVQAAPAGTAISASTVPGDDSLPFYQPPASLPSGNGTLIRSEPMKFYGDPFKFGTLPGQAHRVLYTSTDSSGKPIAVSGVVFVPAAAWKGVGKRPVVGVAPGTQGLADRCAPSRQGDNGTEYEAGNIAAFLKEGYVVAMTDYAGLGTPGLHAYMMRDVQAHAVLDSVRAARSVPNTEVTKDTPVGLTGYSQGGGGAAAAAEVAASYAPDLDIKGVAAGAVPANMPKVAKYLDGSLWSMFQGYALLAGAEQYHVNAGDLMNERGQAMMKELPNTCVFDFWKYGLAKSSNLTKDGRTAEQVLGQEPYKTMADKNYIGGAAPAMPIYVGHTRLDDTIPYPVGAELAQAWCQKNVQVQFEAYDIPLHFGGLFGFNPKALTFLGDRFNGKPFTSNCANLPK